MLILASKATNGSASLVNRFFFQPLYQIFKKQATRQLRATQCYDGINYGNIWLHQPNTISILFFSHTNCKWITFFRDWLHSPYSSKCSFIEQWDDIIIHEYVCTCLYLVYFWYKIHHYFTFLINSKSSKNRYAFRM